MNGPDPVHAPTGKRDGQASNADSDVRASALSARDSLFGRMAVANGFVSQDTLDNAPQHLTEPSKSLGEYLVESGAITEEDRQAIEQLLERHVARHDDDPQKSLSAYSPTVSLNGPPADETQTILRQQTDGKTSSKSFADYELLDEIAKGGMGVVYKARQKNLNRLVALKMILSGEFADEQQVQRFRSEAAAAAKLDHAGIVPVYEVGEQDSQHFYSMAYVEGANLHKKVNEEGPQNAKHAATLMRSVAEAVQFAHDNGIVHRDIKPQNVLLDSKGEPRVTDFGLAKQIHGGSELTATGQIMGTPSYMAPEQATGKIEGIGPTTDVYALGATLYFLLTGRPPFQAASAVETIRQVLDTEPVSPRRLNSDIPRDLETICLKALRKEAGKRYSTAAEFADDLSRWLESKPIVARPFSRTEKVWLWCKRRPAVASLLVAMVVLAVVGAFVVRRREHQIEAEALVERMVTAETEDVPSIIDQMRLHWNAVLPLLEAGDLEAENNGNAKRLLHVRLALVQQNPAHVDFLMDALLAAQVNEVPAIIKSLADHKERLNKRLWQTIEQGSHSERIRASVAQADFNPSGEQWTRFSEDVVTALVSVPASESGEWIELLRPVGGTLLDPLEQRFRDRGESRRNERPLVAAALSVYLEDKPEILTRLILLADNNREFLPVLAALRNHRHSVIPTLQTWVGDSPPKEAEPEERDAFWKKQANAAACLLELGEPESVWPLFQQAPDPSLRSFIIDRLARLGVTPDVLAQRIGEEPDPARRYALILTLGQFDAQNLSNEQRLSFGNQLATIYGDDPDPGVHSATGWALRNWRQKKLADKIDADAQEVGRQDRRWFINSQGQTFALINGPVDFVMGETTEFSESKKVTLSHRFAVATHEVTVEQFQAFRRDHKHHAEYAQQADSPVNMVSWYSAVAYCNWLNAQEDIPPDQWCYEPTDQGEYAEGMKIAADFLSRTGYRLPTDEEWEFMCRAETTSAYGFGEPVELLSRYAWYSDNSDSHMWSIGMKLPNRYGAFDMHGNSSEWCHSLHSPPADQADLEVRTRGLRVLRGESFNSHPAFARSAYRNFNHLASSVYFYGFRLARTMPSED